MSKQFPVGDLTNPNQPPLYADVEDRPDYSPSLHEISEEAASPKLKIPIVRTTTGISMSSWHSGDNPKSEYQTEFDDGATVRGDLDSRSKGGHRKHPPIEKDAWVKSFGEPFV